MKSIEVVAGIICSSEEPKQSRFFATQRGYGDFKGGWEFPGGKMEPGETPQQALIRELKEELAVDVLVGKFLCTVEHDYSTFHLTMHCFFCKVVGGELTLLEHDAAKWLDIEELDSVHWLPADISVVQAIKEALH